MARPRPQNCARARTLEGGPRLPDSLSPTRASAVVQTGGDLDPDLSLSKGRDDVEELEVDWILNVSDDDENKAIGPSEVAEVVMHCPLIS